MRFSYPSTFIIPCSIFDIRLLVKNINKNINIVLGGYHSTVMYDEVCKGNEAGPFDFFVRGRGRLVFQ